jgi:uncharacterized membrane protein YqaE (UPF0057 family)
MATVQLTVVPTLVHAAYVVNVALSTPRIATVYPVIEEPPFAGATQVITTLVPEIAVVGAAGALGGKVTVEVISCDQIIEE